MKALIVIDIDENHLLKETNELYDRLKGYKCELRPMPKTKQHEEEIDYDYGYIDGWNDCIDEILGKTK